MNIESLYRCNFCGGLYQTKISACDCAPNLEKFENNHTEECALPIPGSKVSQKFLWVATCAGTFAAAGLTERDAFELALQISPTAEDAASWPDPVASALEELNSWEEHDDEPY